MQQRKLLGNDHNKPHSLITDPTSSMYFHNMACDLSNKIKYTVGNPTSLCNVAFHWLTSEYMQLASDIMQLAAAGRIVATKYISTVFLKRKC